MSSTLPYFSQSAQAINSDLEELLNDAHREVMISGPTLDVPLFRQDSIEGIFTALIGRNRMAKVQILVNDDKDLVTRCLQLTALVRKVPSIMEVRTADPAVDILSEINIIVDGKHTFHQKLNRRDTYQLIRDDRGVALQRRRDFQDSWNQAVESYELRVVSV